VVARSLDHEIGVGHPGGDQLRPDAGIAGLKRVVRQAGPVAPDGAVELIGPADIDVLVHPVDPLDIRPETGLTRQIERQVDA
jgi:hypothetical protein